MVQMWCKPDMHHRTIHQYSPFLKHPLLFLLNYPPSIAFLMRVHPSGATESGGEELFALLSLNEWLGMLC